MEIRKFEVTVAVPAGEEIPDEEGLRNLLYDIEKGGSAWEVSEVVGFNVDEKMENR